MGCEHHRPTGACNTTHIMPPSWLGRGAQFHPDTQSIWGVLGDRFVGCVGVPEEKRVWGPPLRMALTHASGWLQGRVYSLSANHSAVSIIVSSASV